MRRFDRIVCTNMCQLYPRITIRVLPVVAHLNERFAILYAFANYGNRHMSKLNGLTTESMSWAIAGIVPDAP